MTAVFKDVKQHCCTLPTLPLRKLDQKKLLANKLTTCYLLESEAVFQSAPPTPCTEKKKNKTKMCSKALSYKSGAFR